MDLIRRLFFMCANFGFILSAKHIPGCTNKAADALSRFKHAGVPRGGSGSSGDSRPVPVILTAADELAARYAAHGSIRQHQTNVFRRRI